MFNLISAVGNTPLLYVEKINGNKIYAKCEYFNPTGSVKDRASLYMIKGAVEKGLLKEGGTIIEPTSGNTGIGLAAIGKELGFKVVIAMPENMSQERIDIIKAFGAEIILTDKALGMNGAVAMAQKYCAENSNAYMPMQFANLDNKKAHYEGTAPEIFNILSADYIVAGVGSGGTAIGIQEYINDNRIMAQVVAVQPAESPLLTGGKAAPHGIQGIGANFVPELYDASKIKTVLDINTEEAKRGAKEIALKGVMGGFSGGANYMAAKKIAESVEGKTIVFIVPDTALRYMSMQIYS